LLEDTESLPTPEVIAAEIVEDLQAALDEFSAIADDDQRPALGCRVDGGAMA